MEIERFVFDFVAGVVHPKVFIETLDQHPEIYDWLQSIVPEGLTCYENRMVLDRFGDEEPISVEIPYDIRIVIKQNLEDVHRDRWGLHHGADVHPRADGHRAQVGQPLADNSQTIGQKPFVMHTIIRSQAVLVHDFHAIPFLCKRWYCCRKNRKSPACGLLRGSSTHFI